MKFLESQFEDYIKENNRTNLHTEIKPLYKDIYKQNNNIIFYGPKGCGKYTQALSYIKHFSPSNLKYSRKMLVDFQKHNYTVKISDVNFEIEWICWVITQMLWNSIYYHILDILISRQNEKNYSLQKFPYNTFRVVGFVLYLHAKYETS